MIDEKEKIENRATIQRRTVFKPATWLTKIDFINHLILSNNVLITVLADPCGGKTYFASLLESNLDKKIKSISMCALAACKSKTILGHIASQLQTETGTIADLVTAINTQKQHVLVTIDDAHNLPESFIKEAMHAIKNQGEEGFFHLCLIADFSIVERLNKLAVGEYINLVHSIELGSLSESETRTYVLQRAMADNLIIKPLSEAQYKQFYQLTKGNVAQINASMESFIQNCKPEPKNQQLISVKRVSMAISAFLLIGCGYLAVELYKDVPQTWSQSVIASEPPKVEPIKEIAHEQIAPQEQVIPQEELVSQIPFWLDSAKLQMVQEAIPKQVHFEDDEEDENPDIVAVVDKVVVLPKITMPAAKTKVVAKKPVVKKPVKQKVVKTKAGQFTIQLLASHKKSEVIRYQKRNALLAKTKLRRFSNQAGVWYVLTLGEFENRTQAEQKISKLPDGLIKLHPWIRTTAGLG
ncbi:MAG: SPOR domain-containing protein [Legionella sp.]|jgi:hypothetical protein